MELKLAKRMASLKASDVREILKVTARPEIISFAGGLPAPELFPVEEIKRAHELVLNEDGPRALQYTITEGYPPLRQWLARRMNGRYGLNLGVDNILLTSGSQQCLDLAGKLFLDEGDLVLCESPTYLAAISAFRSYGCGFVEIPTDDEGMDPAALEKALANPKARLIYAIPDFQNPSGRTWSVARRKALAELAARHGVMVVEDNPYGELRFEGQNLPSIQSFDREGCVIYCGSFSKILCPGFRIGWAAGAESVVAKFVLAKQATDIQCNTLAQMSISKFLEFNDIDVHIGRIRDVYRHRRDLLLKTMDETFPQTVAYTRPEGGLFTWAQLPEGLNARQILVESLKREVAFVPGGAFFPTEPKENTLRLNFSNMPDDRIVEGIGRLAGVLKSFIEG